MYSFPTVPYYSKIRKYVHISINNNPHTIARWQGFLTSLLNAAELSHLYTTNKQNGDFMELVKPLKWSGVSDAKNIGQCLALPYIIN